METTSKLEMILGISEFNPCFGVDLRCPEPWFQDFERVSFYNAGC